MDYVPCSRVIMNGELINYELYNQNHSEGSEGLLIFSLFSCVICHVIKTMIAKRGSGLQVFVGVLKQLDYVGEHYTLLGLLRFVAAWLCLFLLFYYEIDSTNHRLNFKCRRKGRAMNILSLFFPANLKYQ